MEIKETITKKGFITAGEYYVYIGIGLMPTTEKRFTAQTQKQIEIFNEIRVLCDELIDLDNLDIQNTKQYKEFKTALSYEELQEKERRDILCGEISIYDAKCPNNKILQ
jgi:hypothetical protein